MRKYQDCCVFSDTWMHCIHFSGRGFCGLCKWWMRDHLLCEKHPRGLSLLSGCCWWHQHCYHSWMVIVTVMWSSPSSCLIILLEGLAAYPSEQASVLPGPAAGRHTQKTAYSFDRSKLVSVYEDTRPSFLLESVPSMGTFKRFVYYIYFLEPCKPNDKIKDLCLRFWFLICIH